MNNICNKIIIYFIILEEELKMKKYRNIIICLSIILTITSCASNQNNEKSTSDDFYEADTSTDSNSQNKTSPISFLKIGNSTDYINLDTVNLYTRTIFGSIKQQNAVTTIYKKTDKFGFGSNYMSVYYYLLMDKTSRNKIEAAYNTYLKEFDAKKLNRKGMNNYRKYGKTKADLRWGTLQLSTPNYGSGDLYLGYEFIEKSPYFCLTIHPVYNLYSEMTDAVARESVMLSYYFTKAQMRDLLDKLSDEALASYFNSEIEVTSKDEY